MPITERGRLVFGKVDERGKRVFGKVTEQGHFVIGSAVTPSPTTGTAVTYSYSSRQQVYKFASGEYNTKQRIYKAVSAAVDMLQEIFTGSVVRVTDFYVKAEIYKPSSSLFATQQQYYKAVQSMTDLKQLISRSQALNYETRQIISKGITTHIETLQRMYESNALDYDVLIQMINDYKEYKKIVKGDLFIIRSTTGELLISQKAKDDIHI